MNLSSRQRLTNKNTKPGHIEEQPLGQNDQYEDLTLSLNRSSKQGEANFDLGSPEATSIYGGVVSSVAVPETPVDSQDRVTYTKTEQPPTNTANWSTSLQTVLDQPPSNLPHKMILGGMVFCLAFGAWAWLGQIEQVGHAQGLLIPKGEVYKIQPSDPGKVAMIGVKEGQAVKAGQMLMELDSQIAAGEVERLQQMQVEDKTQLSQMQGMIDRIRLEAQTRAEISNANTQAQKSAIAEANSKVNTTRELLAQLQTDETAFKARLKRLTPFVEQGAIAKEQLFEAEQALRDRQRSITQNQGDLKQTLAQANQLQAGLIQKQAEGSTAQIEAQQRIQQLKVEMTQLKGKIAETNNLLKSAKTKLGQRFLYAPVTGYVSSLNIRNTGEVVQPGQTIAEMAPENAPLVLSAILPNEEAGFVKVGMPVQVKFDAYPYQDYGVVPGKVISISPDAKKDEKLGAVYRVEVALETNFVTAKHQNIKFKAGQTANADIIIRRRRIADILLEPFRKLQKGGIDL